MKRLLCLLFFAAFLPAAPGQDDEAQTAARKTALDLAGAFSNDGFKLRDGFWAGPLQPGTARIIEVNLYAGNRYWFTVGATSQAKSLALSLYDETGRPVATDPYTDLSRAAAGFAPTASGPYFLKIEELSGGPAAFCLVYSYK